MQQATIQIDGMTCEGCVSSVTRALQQISGVESVEVSLANKNATVNFDDTLTNIGNLKEAIEDAGFDVV